MSDPDNADTTLPWSSSRSTSDHHPTLETINPHTTGAAPNVPGPANGDVRNSWHSNRSFTRPYSAKTVFFYKEGDVYFAGLRVPVSKARYRTIESLLDDLSSNISMPFGVRRLTTPRGKTAIKSIDQLQHHGRYIASSSRAPRPLNLSMVEKIQRIRQANRVHASYFYRSNWLNHQKRNESGRKRRPRKQSLLPVTAKQILFVLNGKPSRIYRAMLNPLHQQTIESLLEEVSEGLQIFSLNDAQLLAVPRNERPIFRESKFSVRTASLPPITGSTTIGFHRQPAIAKQAGPPGLTSAYRENSIERPQRVPAGSSNKKMPLTSKLRLSGRENSESRRVQAKNKMHEKILSEASQHLSTSALEEKPLEKRAEVSVTDLAESSSTAVGTDRNTSGRKELTGERATESGSQEIGTEAEEEESEKEGDYARSDDKSHVQEESYQEDGSANKKQNIPAENETEPSTSELENEDEHGIREGQTPTRNEVVETGEEEDEKEIKKHQAAIIIQAYYRGYRVRKNLKKGMEKSTKTAGTEVRKDDDVKLRIEAAITIQAYWRGYNIRRKLNEKRTAAAGKKAMEPQLYQRTSLVPIDDDEKSIKSGHVAFIPEDSNEDGLLDEVSTLHGMTYTVSVVTGNRWAADTDLDLYIILYGDLNKSERHLLRQDTHEPKFRQNRMDSFHIETAELGLLQKIVIGHDHIGYGAGVFIERVLVTENTADGRQYLFQCAKWFDSGQVDGKIERTLKTTAFCYISTIPDDTKATNGRWELILHSGKEDGSGATTSNLNIVGYGSSGSSITTKIYDSNMAKVPSASLVQVDFGEIGDLLKIRIETDGNGEMPDYYLDYVELKDLDTEERMVSFVRKWLRINSDKKNAQPFREFPVFRAAFEPLNIFSYEGKIKLSSRKRRHLEESICYIQLLGEIGETGRFPVDLTYTSDSKAEVSFKTEAVSIGRIHSTRLFVKTNDIGNELYEGMQILQNIYDRRNITAIAVASDWITDKVTVRESHHAPYRFVMGFSRVKIIEQDDEKVDEELENGKENIFKELFLSEMEGLSTKISKKKALPRKKTQWILSMTIGERSTLIPKVTLCTETTNAEMAIIDTTPTDMIISFQQKTVDISMIVKVRIGIDNSQRLNYIPPEDVKPSKRNIVEVKKFSIQAIKTVLFPMRLYDSANGDELRFPAANTALTSESVYEFPAVWPDIPPISSVVYIITVHSAESSANFDVYLTLSGTRGDTGFRKLTNEENDPFGENKMSTFEIEAVSIGEVLNAEIALRSENQTLKWNCGQMHVLDGETNLFYLFKFNEIFTENLKSQHVNASRLTDAL